MRRTLFLADLKSNAVLLAIIVYVMMYFSIMAYMFDPADMYSFSSMMDMLPEGLLASFGFDKISTNLTAFLVAKLVDNGSFAYFLMSPASRRTIIVTKGCFPLASIAFLFLVLHVGARRCAACCSGTSWPCIGKAVRRKRAGAPSATSTGRPSIPRRTTRTTGTGMQRASR